VQRVRTVVVSILCEQNLTVLLAITPNGPIIQIPCKIEVRKGRKVELQFGENAPQIEKLEHLANVRQVALNIHVRQQTAHVATLSPTVSISFGEPLAERRQVYGTVLSGCGRWLGDVISSGGLPALGDPISESDKTGVCLLRLLHHL
jgi:hypothetical protein